MSHGFTGAEISVGGSYNSKEVLWSFTVTEITTHVGPDGVLNVRLPEEYVDSDVVVRVSRSADARAKRIADIVDPEERQRAWQSFVQRTAGSIDDPTFERPPQGEYEVREEL